MPPAVGGRQSEKRKEIKLYSMTPIYSCAKRHKFVSAPYVLQNETENLMVRTMQTVEEPRIYCEHCGRLAPKEPLLLTQG